MLGLSLVTGAGGFIGSHLTEELARAGRRVRALVHYNSRGSAGWLDTLGPELIDKIEIVAGDVRDPFSMRKAIAGCDTVYHLAALIGIPYSYNAPQSYIETNVSGSLNLFEACAALGVERVIHTSTSEVYGSAQYTPMDERHPLVGQSPYSASKIAADQLAESYHRSFDLPVATVRPFNTFGPRQSARAVIPTIMAQALSGRSTIALGALSPIRDLNYVKDTARGFMAVAAADEAVGKVINVGRGEGVSIGRLAELILEVCESSANIETEESRRRPPRSEVSELVCDNRLAGELLDWRPETSLEEGLRQTADWLRNNMHLYRPDNYGV